MEKWHRTTISLGTTIDQAIKNLDEGGVKIALVVDAAGSLQGTISDGDIRRGLLKGLGLKDKIIEIINRRPIVVFPEIGQEAVLQLMIDHKVQQVPIVDNHNRLIGLHLWEEIATPSSRLNLMVIMAGGRGSRLQPQTETCPKPLLPIAGKPILEHIIERGKKEGFNNFVLAIHYLGHMIEEYFGDGARFGVAIEYLREESPLGTAGALGLLDPRPDLPFVVTNADVLTDIHYGDMLDFHIRNLATATMAIRLHEWQNPFGVVHTRGVEIVDYEEKPISRTNINAGVYVLEPSSLNLLSITKPLDMPALFEQLHLIGDRIVAYPVYEKWLDIGRPDDLKLANIEVES